MNKPSSCVRRALSLRPCAFAVLSLAAACAAHAEQPMQPLLLAQNARMPSLQDMVVTATRTEQPLSDLVADISIVLGRDDYRIYRLWLAVDVMYGELALSVRA